MKTRLGLVFLIVSLGCAEMRAGVYTDELSKCLVESTNSEDRLTLIRGCSWPSHSIRPSPASRMPSRPTSRSRVPRRASSSPACSRKPAADPPARR